MKSNVQSNENEFMGRPFDQNAIPNILSAIDKNRKIATGYNNFRPFTEIPNQGNPYPKQPLAGKYMNEEADTM